MSEIQNSTEENEISHASTHHSGNSEGGGFRAHRSHSYTHRHHSHNNGSSASHRSSSHHSGSGTHSHSHSGSRSGSHSSHSHNSGSSGAHHHSHHSFSAGKSRKKLGLFRKNRRRSSNRFGGLKLVLQKLSRKLSIKGVSSGRGLKKIAQSQKADKRKDYIVRSKRLLFCAAILTVFVYMFWYISSDNEDTDLKNAGYTPSETSQLKMQVMQLEQENELLRKKVEKYTELYGELDESLLNDTPENGGAQ